MEEVPSEFRTPHSALRTYARAWVPWVLLTLFVFAWGLPPVKAALNQLTPRWEVPGLYYAIVRTAPVVPEPRPEEARFDFVWLSATGTGILLAAVASAVWLRVPPGRFAWLWLRTVYARSTRARWCCAWEAISSG